MSEDSMTRLLKILVRPWKVAREAVSENDVRENVRFYRDLGLNVIPLPWGSKGPPPFEWLEYQKRMATDEELRRWFWETISPNNIAIVNGSISGNLVTIDLDNKVNPQTRKRQLGGEVYDKIFKNMKTLKAKTGSGCYHIRLRTQYIQRTAKFSELGVEILGEGSYSVAPPSLHPNGGRYELIDRSPILEFEGDFEAWLVGELRKHGLKFSYEPKEVDINKLLLGVEEGERNVSAIRVATWYRIKGLSEDICLEKLVEWNQKNTPPLPESELEAVVRSAYRPEVPYNYRFVEEEPEQTLTPEIRRFLEDPDLHDNIKAILDTLIVGEKDLKMLLVYVGLGAAIFDKPSGVIAVDVLGSGKSFIQGVIATVFPKSRVHQPTSFSQKAVLYLTENFEGKIVRVDELYGEEEGMPYIRIWMTEGRLEHWVADPETKEVRKQKVEGCPVFFTSTTKEPEEQYASRNYIVSIDTSKLQTRSIHELQSLHEILPEEAFEEEEERVSFLTDVLLYLMQNSHQVLIPFKFNFPHEAPRTRRDRVRFTKLIQSVTNLHQLQRKRVAIGNTTYLVADLKDFELAKKILKSYLLSTQVSLDKYCLKILEFISIWGEDPFTLTELHEGVGGEKFCHRNTLGAKLKHLVQQGYFEILHERGERGSYQYQATPQGLSFEPYIDITITDDGSWALSYYEHLDDPAVLKEFKQKVFERMEEDQKEFRESEGSESTVQERVAGIKGRKKLEELSLMDSEVVGRRNEK